MNPFGFQILTILTVVNGDTAFPTICSVKKAQDNLKELLKMEHVDNVAMIKIAHLGHRLVAPWVTAGAAQKNGTGTEALARLRTPNPAANNPIGSRKMPKVGADEMRSTTRKSRMKIEPRTSSSGKRILFFTSRFPNCCHDWNRLKRMCMIIARIVLMIPKVMENIKSW